MGLCVQPHRVFGLYKMKVMKSKTKLDKIYFVVMVNIFCTHFTIRERYDLKGSLYGRTSRTKHNPNPYCAVALGFSDLSVPLKDLDWKDDKRTVALPAQAQQILRQQVLADLLFFEQNRIIDYSFLIGFVPLSAQVEAVLRDAKSTPKRRFYEVFVCVCLST